MSFTRSALLLSGAVLLSAACAPPASDEATQATRQVPADELLGRWDITVDTSDGSYPSWLELTREGEGVAGRFVGRSGHARPIPNLSAQGTSLSFSLPKQYERMDVDLSFVGELANGRLSGKTNANAPAGTELAWTAVKAPELPAPATVEWGEPIALFNGEDLAGWRLMDPEQDRFWKGVDGILVNDVKDEGDVGEGTGLISEASFENFKLELEFQYPKGSNSGIYLRGRYEVQIQDDAGKDPGNRLIAGVYGFITPTSNPAKPAGEWQSMEITLIGRRVTIVFNGETVIDDQEIPGITGGALDANEGEPGPLFIQGDHGPISFRKVVITPAL